MRKAHQRKPRRFRGRSPPEALRLDGVAHWKLTLDRLLWIMLRAGIDAQAITSSVDETLTRHRHTHALQLPSPEVLEYGRVLTFWRTEAEFLDDRGIPRALPLTGRSGSFRALARCALPGCHPRHVFDVLYQHKLISLGRHRRVTLRAIAFLPKTSERAHFVAITLSALEGILDTCHRNLTAKSPTQSIGRLQRTATAQRFDLKYLKDYDRFLREQATDFLLKQDAWLKRHEVEANSNRKASIAHVGVGVFGFRAE